jgi:hypothetical protein
MGLSLIAERAWDHALYRDDDRGQHVLSVVCGSAGIFLRNIVLTEEETRIALESEAARSVLAERVRANPNLYRSREIAIEVPEPAEDATDFSTFDDSDLLNRLNREPAQGSARDRHQRGTAKGLHRQAIGMGPRHPKI